MEQTGPDTVTLSGEEYIQIGEIARPFWERGEIFDTPTFVMVVGGVAAGKTTHRRTAYAEGYVHLDYGEIYLAFEKLLGKGHKNIPAFSLMAIDMVTYQAIQEKRNIVVEFIGDNAEVMTELIDTMKSYGYKVELVPIIADVAESYKRHLKAVEDDPDYISSHHSESFMLSALKRHFKNRAEGRL